MRPLADQTNRYATGSNNSFGICLPSVFEFLFDRVITKHKRRLPVLRLATKEIGKLLVFCRET